MKTKVDITRNVKLREPLDGEEDIIYKVVNYNDVTERCYIEPINMNLRIPPQELVSINDLVNI